MGRAVGADSEVVLPRGIRWRQSEQRVRELVSEDDPSDGLWFHATAHKFEQFNFKLRRDRRNTGDWSALLGVHFARDGEGVRNHFLYGGRGRVIAAKLRLENPARFGEEYEFERLAFRLLQQDLGFSDKMLALKVHPGTRSPFARAMRKEFLEYLDGTGWKEPRGHRYFLNCDEHIVRTSQLVRRHLIAEGHDGVVYGNSFDFHCVSAIVFAPEQIEIVDRNWRLEQAA